MFILSKLNTLEKTNIMILQFQFGTIMNWLVSGITTAVNRFADQPKWQPSSLRPLLLKSTHHSGSCQPQWTWPLLTAGGKTCATGLLRNRSKTSYGSVPPVDCLDQSSSTPIRTATTTSSNSKATISPESDSRPPTSSAHGLTNKHPLMC